MGPTVAKPLDAALDTPDFRYAGPPKVGDSNQGESVVEFFFALTTR